MATGERELIFWLESPVIPQRTVKFFACSYTYELYYLSCRKTTRSAKSPDFASNLLNKNPDSADLASLNSAFSLGCNPCPQHHPTKTHPHFLNPIPPCLKIASHSTAVNL